MSVETVATARPTVAAAAVTADAAAAEAAASPDAAAAACCHASFEMEGVYERRVRWVDTRGDLADGGGLLLCFDVRGTSDVGILVTDDAEVTDTRQHEVGGPSRDGHSHSHGASADAHHQQQQSSSPADASAAASSATSPAYHVRFANYQNTKTILEKRGETHPLHQVKHAKILNPKRFVSLWLNINIDRVRRRASFSCGFGAPSRTTALLSHLDCELACAVTRIGFTTWSQPIEVRNLRVVSPPLPCVDVWTMSPPCVPLLTPPSTPAMMALDPGPLPRSSSSCSSGTTSAGSFDALTSVAGAEVEVEAGSVVVFGGFSSEEDEDGAAVAAPRVLVRVGDTAFDCDALVLLASSGFFRDVGVGGGGGAAVVVAAAASGPVAADGSAPGASYAVSGSGREVAFTVPAAGSRGGGGGLTPASFAAWYRYVSGDAAATGSALPRDVCALLRTPLTAGQGAFKAGQVAALMEACACGTLCDLRLGCEDAAGGGGGGGGGVACHLAVLRRNAYFALMLGGTSSEEHRSRVVAVQTPSVPAAERPLLARALVEVLYSDCLGVAYADGAALLTRLGDEGVVAAAQECRKYGAQSGFAACERELVKRVPAAEADAAGEESSFLSLCSAASLLGLPALRAALLTALQRALPAVLSGGSAEATRAFCLSLAPDVFAEAAHHALHTHPLARELKARLHGVVEEYVRHSPYEPSPAWAQNFLALLDERDEAGVDAAAAAAAAALAAAEQKTTTFRPGTGGALAHAVEACGGGNPVRAKALRIAASSAKNPLSAGWKLFSGRPRLLCDATQVHARPFVVVGLVGGRLAPTHYELSHCEAEDSIRGWDLLARTGGDEAAKWVLLDERTDQHALSRPYTPALFSLPKQEGVAAYAEFKLVRTDGVDRMTLGSIEFYGVLTEDAPPPSPAE